MFILTAAQEEAFANCATLAQGKCQVQLDNGMRIAYLDSGRGDGRTLILLHGLTDTAGNSIFEPKVDAGFA